MILLDADIVGLSDRLIQKSLQLALGKKAAAAQFKAAVHAEFQAYVDAEWQRLAKELEEEAAFAAKSAAEKVDILKQVREGVEASAHGKVVFELDKRIAAAERNIREAKANVGKFRKDVLDDELRKAAEEIDAIKRVKDALPPKKSTVNASNVESPAVPGSPYHPDSVAARVRPPYKPNPAHDIHSPLYNPKKSPEPLDAAAVYESAMPASIGTWYGHGSEGWYQFFYDNVSVVHFSGIVPEGEVPKQIRKAFGR
jgi:hypothetical protein